MVKHHLDMRAKFWECPPPSLASLPLQLMSLCTTLNSSMLGFLSFHCLHFPASVSAKFWQAKIVSGQLQLLACSLRIDWPVEEINNYLACAFYWPSLMLINTSGFAGHWRFMKKAVLVTSGTNFVTQLICIGQINNTLDLCLSSANL